MSFVDSYNIIWNSMYCNYSNVPTFYRDTGYSDCTIHNYFDNSTVCINVPKYILILNFDYFKSISKYDQTSKYHLDLNLDHNILELCLDLLTGKKTLKDHAGLDDCMKILNTSCALLCCNDNFYTSVIRCIVDTLDQDYKINKYPEPHITFRLCDDLRESIIYSNIKNIIQNRLSYINDPYKIPNMLTSSNNFSKDNTMSLVLYPQCYWWDKFTGGIFGPSSNTAVFAMFEYSTILNPNFTRNMSLTDKRINFGDPHGKLYNTIEFGIKVPDPLKRNISVTAQRISSDYSENILQPVITNYNKHCFDCDKLRVVLKLEISQYDMYYFCIAQLIE